MYSNINLNIYNTHRTVGVDIEWELKDEGFGVLSIYYDKGQLKWKSDTEYLDAETINKILILAAPKLAKLFLRLDPTYQENDKDNNNE